MGEAENIKPGREMLIDAICGRGFPSETYADKMAHIGLAVWTGNQWNEDWAWKRSGLQALTDENLLKLYQQLRRENSVPETETEDGSSQHAKKSTSRPKRN